jgi:hypothetical protein
MKKELLGRKYTLKSDAEILNIFNDAKITKPFYLLLKLMRKEVLL